MAASTPCSDVASAVGKPMGGKEDSVDLWLLQEMHMDGVGRGYREK